MRKIKIGLFVGIVFSLLFASMPVQAQSYVSFTIDQQGDFRLTQSAYLPVGVIDGHSIFGEEGAKEAAADSDFNIVLDQPQDLFIDSHNHLFVADTGNGRILELDERGNKVRVIGQGELDEPTGVYVDEAGVIYAADYGAGQVVVFDPNGKKTKTIGKPDSLLFGKNNEFKPRKVLADKRGNIYIVGEGLIQGLTELSAEGDFLGYFGGNRTGFDLERAVQKIFFTKKQMSQLSQKLPPSPSNLAVDGDGLIYTATVGLDDNSIKKLNVAGDNLLRTSTYMSPSVADIAVDGMGNIFAVDSIEGFISVYDKDGSMLFSFGGNDTGYQRLGYFRAPSGIAVNENGILYVLDKERANIQMFKPTPFALLVYKAIGLYLDGKYVQSMEPWREVLRQNSMFDLAHVGIGLAYYKQGDYSKAFEELKFARNVNEYSNTYWELRRAWMMSHMSTIMVAIAGAAALWFILKRLYRAKGIGKPVVQTVRRIRDIKIIRELMHTFRMLRHPFDGYYELENGRASVLSATLLLIFIVAIRIYEVFGTNFIFSGVDPLKVNIIGEALKILIPFFAWVLCNYLVSIINDGEGKFKDIYKGTVYALSPYIIFSLPITIMSKGLTLLESVVYDYSRQFIILWCVFLMFTMVKEIHGYEIKETFKNVAITISSMIIMALIAFIFFGLSNQVWDFVRSIAEEVKYRV
ncbi:DNA-binding beta-propeller fold protein YncE [Paenibacillus castaneae]|uniref:YIP1 family protein n=1 Tax=Paenibacillus castaneae TaxID=474957 RepID=UPI000C9ABA19|nr:YIP1 family protein [Paenibacillus castaneae]NIK77126.1 DNA-binding beta-propeller fold protein YncE [Paenibacillus castaneae]